MSAAHRYELLCADRIQHSTAELCELKCCTLANPALPLLPCTAWVARHREAPGCDMQELSPGTSGKAPAADEAPLLAVLPCGHIRDTHAKGLANPAQQPDRLILAGSQVT